MATTVKEKVEAKEKVAEVAKADARVEEIKAKKAADKAKRHADREAKHPKLGKVINWVDDNKAGIGVGVAVGGPIGIAAFLAGKKIVETVQAKKAGDATDDDADDSEVVDTTTFD